MARCSACGSRILFGGVAEAPFKFCGQPCRARYNLRLAATLPPDFVAAQLQEFQQAPCPRCHGPGPVDIHLSHWVWSILILTRWGSTAVLTCRRCATSAQLWALSGSFIVGWWGFPFGLVITPVQIGYNLVELLKSRDPAPPSQRLQTVVLLQLGAQVAHQVGQGCCQACGHELTEDALGACPGCGAVLAPRERQA